MQLALLGFVYFHPLLIDSDRCALLFLNPKPLSAVVLNLWRSASGPFGSSLLDVELYMHTLAAL